MSEIKMAASFENRVILLQAFARGFLVRRKLREVRNEFEDIVSELEKDKKFVCWEKDSLGRPLITSDLEVFERTNQLYPTGGLTQKHDEDNNAVTEINRNEAEENSISNTVENNSDLNKQNGSEEGNLNFTEHRPKVDQEQSISEDGNNLELSFIPEITQAENTESDSHTGGERAQCFQQQQHTPREMTDFPVAVSLSSTPQCFSNGETREAGSAYKSSSQVPAHQKPFHKEHPLLSESWMTDKSFGQVFGEESNSLPTDPVKLQELRDHIGMELLWTEQAIQSRKKYLSLRKGMLQSDQEEDPSDGWE